MAKLTEKQKRFCDEYLICFNAVQAAINAGYSKATARFASKWINENENPRKPTEKSKFIPEMRKYIDDRMAEKEKTLIADQDEVMRYLTAVMRREKSEHVVVTVREKKIIPIDGEDGKIHRMTEEKEVPKVVEIPSRLSDSNKAAELLGKAYGIYTDKMDIDVDGELNINIDYGDDS